MQLLVDDGVPNRSHRRNLFDEDFTVTGIFSGSHKTHRKMTCIDYADSYETGGPPPVDLEDQMDEFLQEEVIFNEMPLNCKGYSQSLNIRVIGRKATKTITRTCSLIDDTEVVLKVTESRKFPKIVKETTE